MLFTGICDPGPPWRRRAAEERKHMSFPASEGSDSSELSKRDWDNVATLFGQPEEVVTSFPVQTQKESFLQGSQPISLSHRLLGRNHMTELSRASLPIFLEMTIYCESTRKSTYPLI